MAPTSNILLRLDDGSIIGDATKLGQPSFGGSNVVRITTEQAFAVGRVGDAEIRRLERVLSSLRGTGPSQQNGGGSFSEPHKRARLAVEHNFNEKCSQILKACFEHMDQKSSKNGLKIRDIFYPPVNRSVFPAYYTMIKHPICFSEIERKLATRSYASHHDFYADCSLLWSNCRTFNPLPDPVGLIGIEQEMFFEQQWAASGWGSDVRGRRATAGIAADKFDPDVFAHQSRPKASGAQSLGGRSRRPSTSARSGGGGGGGNHEVTSSQQPGAGGRAAAADRPIGPERRIQIAAQLMELVGESAEDMAKVLALIPQEFMLTDEDGETELDFENIDDATMKTLDAFLRNHSGGGGGGTASPNTKVRLDEDSEEEDDPGAGSDSD